MTITTVLAVYGAIISTILLVYKFVERKELHRRFFLQLDKHYVPNIDQVNYHDGRMGNQVLRLRITNKSLKENSITDAYFVSFSIRYAKKKYNSISFNFSYYPLTKYPARLGYTEQITILTPLNMLPGEYHQSWKSNAEILQNMTAKYIQAIVVDTQGKKYFSKAVI